MAFENSSRSEHGYRSHAPSHRSASQQDPALRELLTFLRDFCREAAVRIDRYLGDNDGGRNYSAPQASYGAADASVRPQLDRLLEEARGLSHEAPEMNAPELRTRIQAMTAETRSLQARAGAGEDRDTAARILRMLTAIVSEYRPGHVYGLARHHQADWDELGRRARRDLAEGNFLRDSRERSDDSGEYRGDEGGTGHHSTRDDG